MPIKHLFARLAHQRAQAPRPDTIPRWSFQGYKECMALLEQVKHDIRIKDFDAAEAHLATARSGLGCDRSVLMASAEIAQARAHWPEAQRRWQCVIDAHPDMVIAHAQRAHAVHAQGETSRAVEMYHQLIRQFPDDVGAPISLVNLLDRLDADARDKFAAVAEAGLDHLIRKHPTYTVLLVARARLAKARDDWPAAFADLVRARDVDKSDSRIWAEIREVLEVIEDRKQVTQSLFDTRAAPISPAGPE